MGRFWGHRVEKTNKKLTIKSFWHQCKAFDTAKADTSKNQYQRSQVLHLAGQVPHKSFSVAGRFSASHQTPGLCHTATAMKKRPNTSSSSVQNTTRLRQRHSPTTKFQPIHQTCEVSWSSDPPLLLPTKNERKKRNREKKREKQTDRNEDKEQNVPGSLAVSMVDQCLPSIPFHRNTQDLLMSPLPPSSSTTDRQTDSW